MQSPQSKLITLDNVGMQFDKRFVLDDVNLQIHKGDFFAITGPNGGGKTTLLRIILKLIHPTFGTVKYWNNDEEVKELKIGYLPQKNLIDGRFPISVREVIASGLLGNKSMFAKYTSEDKAKIDEIMQRMGVEQLANMTLGSLSGGQMQRALLGRALISEPEVLILDEPLSYVDKRFEHQIYNMIEDLAKNTTIILVSHEMTAINPIANRHIIVDRTIHECHASKHCITTCCDE